MCLLRCFCLTSLYLCITLAHMSISGQTMYAQYIASRNGGTVPVIRVRAIPQSIVFIFLLLFHIYSNEMKPRNEINSQFFK